MRIVSLKWVAAERGAEGARRAITDAFSDLVESEVAFAEQLAGDGHAHSNSKRLFLRFALRRTGCPRCHQPRHQFSNTFTTQSRKDRRGGADIFNKPACYRKRFRTMLRRPKFSGNANNHRIFTARPASSAITRREIRDWSIIRIFAQRDSTGTSVGEKAVLVLKARNR